jgi:hypothetical protein
MSLDEGQTHYVGDGCQSAHDPRIDAEPVVLTDAQIIYDFGHEIGRLKHEVERLQRENGSLARMNALCEDTLRDRQEKVNQAEAFVDWHLKGQPRTPGTLYPMTYATLDQWHEEWDRRLAALIAALARDLAN